MEVHRDRYRWLIITTNKKKIKDDLDDFLLFNACEDARDESKRENNSDNYNSFDSSWDSGSSNNDY